MSVSTCLGRARESAIAISMATSATIILPTALVQTLEEILAIRRDAVTMRFNLTDRSGKQSR